MSFVWRLYFICDRDKDRHPAGPRRFAAWGASAPRAWAGRHRNELACLAPGRQAEQQSDPKGDPQEPGIILAILGAGVRAVRGPEA